MNFTSREVAPYTATDLVVAQRVADYVALALSHHRLSQEAQRAAEACARASALETRVKSLSAELNAVTGYRRVVGESQAWKSVLKRATQVAATDTTVLLLGESGTGKEVVARLIDHPIGLRGICSISTAQWADSAGEAILREPSTPCFVEKRRVEAGADAQNATIA